jgi:phosphoribosylanthranilate isomerase
MSRIAIKICGLSTPETVGAAVRAGASHVGFVHFPKSPRHVEPDQCARSLRPSRPMSIASPWSSMPMTNSLPA